jgi:4-hydroxy-L-threonine phosphate dehydrogenase PdxA
MAENKRPILGITMGDAAGIGPEVLAKSLAVKEVYDLSRPFIIGSSYAMAEAVKLIKKRLKIREIGKASEATGDFRTIDVMDMQNLNHPKSHGTLPF